MVVVNGLAGKDTRLLKTFNLKSEVNRKPEYTVYKCSFGHLFNMYLLCTQNIIKIYQLVNLSHLKIYEIDLKIKKCGTND